MSVQFDDQNNYNYNSYYINNDQNKGITGLVLKTGIVKNESQANLLLIVLAVIFFSIALFLIFSDSGSGQKSHPIDNEAMQKMAQTVYR